MANSLEPALARIRELHTNGANDDVMTEDIVARLQDWSRRCAFEVSEIEHDALVLRFETLPEDLDAFAAELYEFCPDVIDQGFGCFAELIDAAEEGGQEVPEAIRELVAGVDLSDDNYGMELLRRALRRDKVLQLWWD